MQQSVGISRFNSMQSLRVPGFAPLTPSAASGLQ
jgi:hypothetical protein